MKKAANSNSKCEIHKGAHRYQFKQIIQPVYHAAKTNQSALSIIGNARLVQVCECGHQLVNEV